MNLDILLTESEKVCDEAYDLALILNVAPDTPFDFPDIGNKAQDECIYTLILDNLITCRDQLINCRKELNRRLETHQED
jgi:hypothetical protein